MKSKNSKNLSIIVIAISFIGFIFITYKAITVVQKRQISVSDGIYENRVTTAKEIEEKASTLTLGCDTRLCQAQSLLDDVSVIPYKTDRFQRNSPQKTIQLNFGDCDDKSNLLISMLHSLGIEAYFVLVPEHIFVIVPIDDVSLSETKGLWIAGKKYYILESTAKGSKVGFPLKYKLDEIDTIMDPFTNEKVDIKGIKYKL